MISTIRYLVHLSEHNLSFMIYAMVDGRDSSCFVNYTIHNQDLEKIDRSFFGQKMQLGSKARRAKSVRPAIISSGNSSRASNPYYLSTHKKKTTVESYNIVRSWINMEK